MTARGLDRDRNLLDPVLALKAEPAAESRFAPPVSLLRATAARNPRWESTPRWERPSPPAAAAQENLSETGLRSILDMGIDGLLIVDTRGLVRFANQALGRMLGYPPGELVGRVLWDLVPAARRADLQARFVDLLLGPREATVFETDNLRQDGSRVPAEVHWNRLPHQGQVQRIIVNVRDITRRRQAEQASLAQERQLRELNTLHEQDPVPLLRVDFDGRVAYCNAATRTLLGKLGYGARDTALLLPPGFRELLTRVQSGRERIADLEHSVDDHHFSCTIIQPEGQDYVHLYLEEVTRRKEIEAQLLESERLAAIGEVAAGIAYELNAPLANLSLLADNLSETARDSEARNMAERSLEQVDVATQIVKELLDFARPSKCDFARHDVNHIVETSLAQVAIPQAIRLSLKLKDNLPTIYGDQYQLRSVITNLANNALHALAEQDEGRLTVTTSATLSGVQLEIQDNASTLPNEDLTDPDSPCFTTQRNGNGTGLKQSVLRRIVHAHSGNLKVEARNGHGTTVTITIPCRTRTEARKGAGGKERSAAPRASSWLQRRRPTLPPPLPAG